MNQRLTPQNRNTQESITQIQNVAFNQSTMPIVQNNVFYKTSVQKENELLTQREIYSKSMLPSSRNSNKNLETDI